MTSQLSNLLNASDSLSTLYEDHTFYPPPSSKQLSRVTSIDNLQDSSSSIGASTQSISIKALETQISALKQIQEYQERISDPSLLLTLWRRKVYELMIQSRISESRSNERIQFLEKELENSRMELHHQKQLHEESLQNTRHYYIGKEQLYKLEISDLQNELNLGMRELNQQKSQKEDLKAYFNSTLLSINSLVSKSTLFMDKIQKDLNMLDKRLEFSQDRIQFAIQLQSSQNQQGIQNEILLKEIQRLKNDCQMLVNQLNYKLPHEHSPRPVKQDAYQRLYSLSKSLLQEEEQE